MMKFSLKLKLQYNFIFLFILISNIKGKEDLNKINNYKNSSPNLDLNQTGIVLIKYINSKNIELEFETNNKLLLHFLSIDCEISIEAEYKKKKIDKEIKEDIDVMQISYYNYGAFTSIIEKNAKFKIILLSKEKNKNRNYPLIINSIKIDEPKIPELIIKENEPAFLYFNNDLKKINLVYNFEERNIEYPIIVSFFIKEKTKFKVEVKDGENNIMERNINYKENIIIKPKSSKGNYTISISPNEEIIINSTMIVRIIQSNSSPFFLIKSQLNLGFIPIELDYYYYYMEVFKGEGGEIILFNKRQNGILISKIIEKSNNITPLINEFPKFNGNDILSNDFLEFDIYNQKLSFDSSYTEKCEEGCFLLITYYSNISKSLEINGTEFSILSRIWDEEELISQIIHIPLDEYIFGSINDTLIKYHYYSVFIPFETDDIYIELHGLNILGYSKEGIGKINTNKMTSNIKKLFEDWEEKIIVKLNKEDIKLVSFKWKYISFTFEPQYEDNSYYYFRILQEKPGNNYLVYPLDTNKENFCETKENKCYFILKNEYNDLLNKIVIYGFGKNEVSYKVFNMMYTDYFSSNLNISNLKEIKELESSNSYLNLNMKNIDNFVLLVIESNSREDEIVTVISSFYNQPDPSFINLYSYQLFYLNETTFQQFHLYQNPFVEYRILINNIKGEGYICFNQTYNTNNNYIHLTEQKLYSFSIINHASFFIYAKNILLFSIKVIYEILQTEIKELKYQYNFKKINSYNEEFPLLYFIKDIKYNGININFNFNFYDSVNKYNNLIIKGYELDYIDISFINDKQYFINEINNYPYKIKGYYDNITNSGSIELSNEILKKKYNETYKYTEDKYFVIIIDTIKPFEFENLSNKIYVFSKDKNYILLPINRYIRNSFNLLENKTIIQRYFFEKEKIINKFILEFSSNYENFELKFNNLTNYSTRKKIGGFIQYILSIKSKSSIDYYFNVAIKPTNTLNLEKALKDVNIIIKYYNEENKINTDYICNKNIELDKIKIKNKTIDCKLIIKNKYEKKNSLNNLNFIYYLRLINKKNILSNEELNTIAYISSNLSYINKFNTIEPYKDFSFNLTNLKNNEIYIASIFLKTENINEEEEKYCSMIYEINTNLKENVIKRNIYLKIFIIIIIIVAVFIIILISFIIICCKMKNKKKNLQDKIKIISFSSEVDEDLINSRESIKSNEEKENIFV